MYEGIKGISTYFWHTRYTRVPPKVLTVSTSSRQNTLQVYTEVLKCCACLPARVASIQGGPVAIALEEENKSHFEMFEIRQSFPVLLCFFRGVRGNFSMATRRGNSSARFLTKKTAYQRLYPNQTNLFIFLSYISQSITRSSNFYKNIYERCFDDESQHATEENLEFHIFLNKHNFS